MKEVGRKKTGRRRQEGRYLSGISTVRRKKKAGRWEEEKGIWSLD
jgi:hypothetical protein